jgi:hypothetical protein
MERGRGKNNRSTDAALNSLKDLNANLKVKTME